MNDADRTPSAESTSETFRVRQDQDQRHPTRSWLIGASCLAIAISVGATIASESLARNDREQSRRAFAASSAQVSAALQLGIEHEHDLVVSTRAFVSANPEATQDQFASWADSVEAFPRYPELSVLGYAVIVTKAELPGFARQTVAATGRAQSPGTPFAVTPPGDRDFYCFMKIGQVRDNLTGGAISNEGLDFCAGTDMASVILSKSEADGTYAPLRVGQQTMLVVNVPVYGSGAPPLLRAAREADFVGWIGMTVSPQLLLDQALAGHSKMAVTMRYRGAPSDVVFSGSGSTHSDQSRTIDLHNGWTVQTYGARGSGGLLSNAGALWMLACGLVVAIAAGALTYVLGTSRGRALRLVTRKTGELQHLALHDVLTGLPNRALLLDRADQAIVRARRDGNAVGVMFLDLDRFKNVNDTLGHATGDDLLRAVASRLTGVLRESDTVGRIGGDEFVVILEGQSLDGGPELAAERVRDVLAQPFHLPGSENLDVTVQVSIGIAVGLRANAERLLNDADIALYEAKATGKDRYVVFTSDMQEAMHARLQLEMDLQDSVNSDEFFVVYQPTIETWRVSRSPAWKRCCAGSTQFEVSSCPMTLFPLPSKREPSCHLVVGSWPKPASRPSNGRVRVTHWGSPSMSARASWKQATHSSTRSARCSTRPVSIRTN